MCIKKLTKYLQNKSTGPAQAQGELGHGTGQHTVGGHQFLGPLIGICTVWANNLVR